MLMSLVSAKVILDSLKVGKDPGTEMEKERFEEDLWQNLKVG